MTPEDKAWFAFRARAHARLPAGFADRVLAAARGPGPESWRQLHAHGAAQIRPGFVERVVRAARAAAEGPSFTSQLALSAATAALCLAVVLFLHVRQVEETDARNLAEWRTIVALAQEMDSGGR